MAGDSPGYSLSLVAETTTGVLLSVERTANSRPGAGANPTATATGSTNWVATSGGNAAAAAASSGSTGFGGPELPEDVGREGAMMLLQEIYKGAIVCIFSLRYNDVKLSLFRSNIIGGVVDSMHQPLVLQLMVLTPEDVSKVISTTFLAPVPLSVSSHSFPLHSLQNRFVSARSPPSPCRYCVFCGKLLV